MKRFLNWLGFAVSARPIEVFMGCPNSFAFVKQEYPIGKILYTHYPKGGLYRVCGYQDESTQEYSHVDLLGEFILALDFGYPDESCRGILLEQIINGERTFQRGQSEAWEVTRGARTAA